MKSDWWTPPAEASNVHINADRGRVSAWQDTSFYGCRLFSGTSANCQPPCDKDLNPDGIEEGLERLPDIHTSSNYWALALQQMSSDGHFYKKWLSSELTSHLLTNHCQWLNAQPSFWCSLPCEVCSQMSYPKMSTQMGISLPLFQGHLQRSCTLWRPIYTLLTGDEESPMRPLVWAQGEAVTIRKRCLGRVGYTLMLLNFLEPSLIFFKLSFIMLCHHF